MVLAPALTLNREPEGATSSATPGVTVGAGAGPFSGDMNPEVFVAVGFVRLLNHSNYDLLLSFSLFVGGFSSI